MVACSMCLCSVLTAPMLEAQDRNEEQQAAQPAVKTADEDREIIENLELLENIELFLEDDIDMIQNLDIFLANS
jgi:hypothetical protein